MNPSQPKLIHVAYILVQNQGWIPLFLRQLDLYRYVWFREHPTGNETETSVWAGTIEDALISARKAWSLDHFRTLNCGFRYTLPERDEIGTNALFHQMASSYASMSGVYFDEELSFNCIVQNPSLEARNLLKRLQQTNQIYTEAG